MPKASLLLGARTIRCLLGQLSDARRSLQSGKAEKGIGLAGSQELTLDPWQEQRDSGKLEAYLGSLSCLRFAEMAENALVIALGSLLVPKARSSSSVLNTQARPSLIYVHHPVESIALQLV